jgi:hypothetical protein
MPQTRTIKLFFVFLLFCASSVGAGPLTPPKTASPPVTTKPPEVIITPQAIEKFRNQWRQYRVVASQLRQALINQLPSQYRQTLDVDPVFAQADLSDEAIVHLLRIGYSSQNLLLKTQLLNNELERLQWLKGLQQQNNFQQTRLVNGGDLELIDNDQIKPSPLACEETTYELVWGFIHTNNTLETILAADRWFCRQEEFGENAALECAIIEELVAISANVVRTGGICLSAKGTARTEANLENLDSIQEFLNERFNVTVGSRVSDEQLEALKTRLDQVQQTLDEYLPVQFPAIRQRLDDLIAALQQTELQLLDVHARVLDLQQRSLLTNAESEDIDERLADIQQSGMEIRDDTQAAILRLNNLRSSLAQHGARQNGAFQVLRQDYMATVLSQDVDGRLVLFQVPAIYGGLLEKVREYVLAQLLKAQQLGLNTSAAQATFATGDGQLNGGDYHQAYRSYVLTYRQLGQLFQQAGS